MQWALINGETKTGISAFWLDAGMDSGPVFQQKELEIHPDDDARTLREKLIPLGLSVLENVINDVDAAHIVRKPQEGEATIAPLLKKEMGLIDWAVPAQKIVNLIRGISEWPGAHTSVALPEGLKKNLKIIKATADSSGRPKSKPGQIVEIKKDVGFYVETKDGRLLIETLQPEGKKPMSAWAFWQGARMRIGDKFD
jgi:methionyl-tRNA formyltransferase